MEGAEQPSSQGRGSTGCEGPILALANSREDLVICGFSLSCCPCGSNIPGIITAHRKIIQEKETHMSQDDVPAAVRLSSGKPDLSGKQLSCCSKKRQESSLSVSRWAPDEPGPAARTQTPPAGLRPSLDGTEAPARSVWSLWPQPLAEFPSCLTWRNPCHAWFCPCR